MGSAKSGTQHVQPQGQHGPPCHWVRPPGLEDGHS
jgi:hypothetical protein